MKLCNSETYLQSTARVSILHDYNLYLQLPWVRYYTITTSIYNFRGFDTTRLQPLSTTSVGSILHDYNLYLQLPWFRYYTITTSIYNFRGFDTTRLQPLSTTSVGSIKKPHNLLHLLPIGKHALNHPLKHLTTFFIVFPLGSMP